MGAWGTGPFENDDAGDWSYELGEGGIAYIRDTLETITTAHAEDYLEAPYCSNAIAAAEVVAAMKGSGLKDLPEEVTSWLETKPKAPPDLVKLAREAVSRLITDSELKDVWDEALPEDAELWKASVDDLLKRLS